MRLSCSKDQEPGIQAAKDPPFVRDKHADDRQINVAVLSGIRSTLLVLLPPA